MHLERITGRTVDHAAATGGNADALALLLGGESGAEVPAFSATLQAALSAGGTNGETLDAADAVLADDDASGEDETGTSLAAALAAAFGLGAVVNPQVPEEAGTADGGEPALDPQAVDVSASSPSDSSGELGGTVATASAAAVLATGATDVDLPETDVDPPEEEGATSLLAAADDAAAAATVRTSAPALDGGRSAGSDAPPASQLAEADDAVAATIRPSPDPIESGRRPGGDGPPSSSADPSASGARSGAVANALSAELAAARPTSQAASNGTSSGTHHGVVGAADVAATTAFSSGGSGQQALDLGTPDRQVFALVGKPATVLTTATAAGYEGEQIPKPVPVPGAGAGDAPTTLLPLHATGAPQDAAAIGPARIAQHPTGIEARWGERVVDALRMSAVRGGGEIRLQLDPPGLGHIDVCLHLQPDGVRAVIVAEHESTRALLTSQQQVLQEAFNRSDLRLSGFSVDVGSGGGAATFGRGGDAGEGGSAPPSPNASVPTAETLESTAAPLANGRVSVRV